MFCAKCGKQIDDDSAFCVFCGQQVGAPVVNARPVIGVNYARPKKKGMSDFKKVMIGLLVGFVACIGVCVVLSVLDSDDKEPAIAKVKEDEESVFGKTSEKEDLSKQENYPTTILDNVKYVDGNDYEMQKNGRDYLEAKGITYLVDDSSSSTSLFSTLSDDFLGYRAYYSWGVASYDIILTFDSEDELKQAVSDVRNYLSNRADAEFEDSDFFKAVEVNPSIWKAVFYCYAHKYEYEDSEIFCTDYKHDSQEFYIEAISFRAQGGLSDFKANGHELILGDCENYIEIIVVSKSFKPEDGRITNSITIELDDSKKLKATVDWSETYYALEYDGRGNTVNVGKNLEDLAGDFSWGKIEYLSDITLGDYGITRDDIKVGAIYYSRLHMNNSVRMYVISDEYYIIISNVCDHISDVLEFEII